MNMAEEPQSLRQCFTAAERAQQRFESAFDTISEASQSILLVAISKYETCLRIVDEVALFSPNESLEDVSSGNLQYLITHFHIGELILRRADGERRHNLWRARGSLEKFLRTLDSYDALSGGDFKTFEHYLENPDGFATTTTNDAAQRRQIKIARFKEERALKHKIEYLRERPAALDSDDAALRSLHLTNIALCVHQTFQSLETIAQELGLLSLAPPTPPSTSHDDTTPDTRNKERNAQGDSYSDKLDAPSSGLLPLNNTGPMLSKDGKALRPFTLLDHRQRLQQGVFRPDHNLPTMTIDEYLEEERRRGGITNGGGPQSQVMEAVDEDDMATVDEATMKARAWDDFVEENPKGEGNRMNMG